MLENKEKNHFLLFKILDKKKIKKYKCYSW